MVVCDPVEVRYKSNTNKTFLTVLPTAFAINRGYIAHKPQTTNTKTAFLDISI